MITARNAMNNSVASFYAGLGQGEWDRLEDPFLQIEFLSTLRLINKYFPSKGHVLDVGGGPGRYSIELLNRGYKVTLLDLSPELISLADSKLNSLNLVAEGLHVGDARDLAAFKDNTFDALLLMGPLYHLPNRLDRLQALKEARRVLRPGGRALIAYLNAWGLIRTGLTHFPEKYEDPQFVQSMFHEGGVGIWYWSNPDLAKGELTEAGFDTLAYGGMEGFAGGMAAVINKLAAENPRAYEQVLKAAVDSSELAPFRDSTDHLHLVVTYSP
jgi:S-adenosylmethionine-dependent methyltransferase